MDSTPLSPEQQMEAYQAFLQVTKDTLVLNYLLVAFYALLIYDAALTFECEYIFIWFCRYMFYVVQFIPTALFILITVFLAMRTYALWRGQRLVKYLLIALVIFCNVGTFIGISVSSAQVEFLRLPIPRLTCVFTVGAPTKTAGIVIFSTSIVFDFSIFAVTTIRAYQYFMQGNKRIVVGIFKDCLLYYAFLFSTGVVTLVLYLAIPPERAALQGVLINPMRSMSVMIASRIVLNLRRIVLAPGAVTSSELLGTGTDSGYTSTNSIAWGRV
ncbi:hypothetical protein CCMSSC00406_0005264 [Pleurotus cornucopiae]|uniref:Uncharacterized protein n=1 Tax=Pleurotus cornucopiae TaxID=5321 RepID=A0ACB7IJH4_PLECO|nr:hypothetical protein CCMSSC00406_0005264 [Pleurotus cornucopiae]